MSPRFAQNCRWDRRRGRPVAAIGSVDARFIRRLRFSRALSFDPRRALKDFAEPRLRRRGRRGWVDPVGGVDLIAEMRLAPRPARHERGDDEMRLHLRPLACDRLDMPFEGDDLGLDARVRLSAVAADLKGEWR